MSTTRRVIKTDSAPVPTGPFNQGMVCGPFVFTSGQAGRNRDTGEMGDLPEQIDWALRNIQGILEEGGASMQDVVKVTLYVRDDADTSGLNDVYTRYFEEPRPPRSTVFVSRLKNDEMLVEAEAIAMVA